MSIYYHALQSFSIHFFNFYALFYGAGAGKLPTASAVVSDVVDCARHMGKTIMCFWDDEDVKLAGIETVSRSFFVRVGEQDEAKVKELFGNVDKVKAEGLDDEFAFVTDVMTEKEFSTKAAQLSDLRSRIRVESI